MNTENCQTSSKSSALNNQNNSVGVIVVGRDENVGLSGDVVRLEVSLFGIGWGYSLSQTRLSASAFCFASLMKEFRS